MSPDPLLAYVTNPDRDVFALRNLPEEVVAVLFAYYSRSRDDLRTNLRRLLDDADLAVIDHGHAPASLATAQSKARAFHEKWVVGYGHGSVAEHGVVHLAVENCSIVAAKALEEARLAAYTEKSTRYVRFSPDTLVTAIGLPLALQKRYEAGARNALETYTQLVPVVEMLLAERHPLPVGTGAKAHENALRSHALDLLRGLLPAGVPTNVGITINGRALEHHLSTLMGSPLLEVRNIAAAMRDEARTVLPTLVKYVDPSAHRTGVRERVMRAHGGLHEAVRSNGPSVTLLDATRDPLRTLASAIHVEQFDSAWSAAWTASADETRARAIVAAYLADRGPHDGPLRALEQVVFRFEVVCDYGAWRDLQRHRLLSATTPRLASHEGYAIPDELVELGVGPKYAAAIEHAATAFGAIEPSHPWEAQYVLPLAFRVRYTVQANLREVFHLVELRSARQGHDAYRRIAIALADAVLTECPWLDGAMRVDRNAYPWARH